MEYVKLWNHRSIDEHFIADLNTGILQPFRDLVRHDGSLLLEIRRNRIEIYYNGGKLYQIEKIFTKRSGNYYRLSYTDGYFQLDLTKNLESTFHNLSNRIVDEQIANRWCQSAEIMKRAMQEYFTVQKKDEQRVTQQVVLDNNFGLNARGNEYFFCDTEYTNTISFTGAEVSRTRLDLVGARIPMVGEKSAYSDASLIVIEMKYGFGAFWGASGVKAHVCKLKKFFNKPEYVNELQTEMEKIAEIKLALGLFEQDSPLNGLRYKREKEKYPEYIIALVKPPKSNRTPGLIASLKTRLRQTLNEISKEISTSEPLRLDVKFAILQKEPYLLYPKSICSLSEFQDRIDDLVDNA